MKRSVVLIMCVFLLAGICVTRAQEVSQTPYKPGAGVSAPRLLREVKPVYPPEALTSGEEGIVTLECVVQADGTVGDIRVVGSRGAQLDAAAVKALKQWRFSPGRKDDKPVPVEVMVEISFHTEKKGPRLGSPDVYKAGPGVVLPKLLKDTKPVYPDEAKQKGVQGTVNLDCVVLPDGTIGDVRVSRSLEPALDAEAMRAVREWRFQPGTKDGKAVPVQVAIEMSFSLR